MKVTTSLIPELVFYTKYSDCTITEALLHAFQNSKWNTLSLPDIGNIKVNWNRLLGSYWKNIQNLRRQGYDIETNIYHDTHKHITRSSYTLKNPTHSPTESDLFINI